MPIEPDASIQWRGFGINWFWFSSVVVRLVESAEWPTPGKPLQSSGDENVPGNKTQWIRNCKLNLVWKKCTMDFQPAVSITSVAWILMKSMACAFNWSAEWRSAKINTSLAVSIWSPVQRLSSHITFKRSRAYLQEKHFIMTFIYFYLHKIMI